MLYGPNTNIVVNGSIIYFSECEVHYVMGCVSMLLERRRTGRSTASPTCTTRYNERIDDGEPAAWPGASSNVNSWYKNDEGRVAQNWPFNLIEYWQQTRAVDPADYNAL